MVTCVGHHTDIEYHIAREVRIARRGHGIGVKRIAVGRVGDDPNIFKNGCKGVDGREFDGHGMVEFNASRQVPEGVRPRAVHVNDRGVEDGG